MVKNKTKQRKEKTNRSQEALRKVKVEEDMKKPINVYLNAWNDDGTPKYDIADRIMKHYLYQPQLVTNNVRMVNSLLHELRFHIDQSNKYYANFNNKEINEPVKMVNEHGKIMTKEECYTAYIKEKQVNYIVLDKLRSVLIEGLLEKVDNDLYTFDMFDKFVNKVEQIVHKLGYTLFPTEIEEIEPL